MATIEAPVADAQPEGLPEGQRFAAMIAILVPVAMSTLDTVITNTALPSIAASINADAPSVIWVVTSYQLAMVATLLPFAALAERIGYRRLYVYGLVLFTLASLVCGLAWSLESLVVARALQGVGAAALMSVNTALIRFVYPARILGRGLGLNAFTSGVAFTAGPTVASIVLSFTTWHWLFLVNVPAGLIAIWLSLRNLPTSAARASARFDGVAALLCGGFFFLLVLGIGTLSHNGEWGVVLGEWAAALGCAIILTRRQAGHPAPMLAVDLYKRPMFALSALTSICSFATQGLAFVALPFLLQTAFGKTQVETGFLMTPWPLVVAVMAPIAGRLSDRYAPGMLGGFGLLALSAGMATLALLPPAPTAFDIGWRMVLCGLGFGFFQAPNLKAIMSSAPTRRSGGASGTVAMSRLLGQSSGAALVALCFYISLERGPEIALWLGCGFSFAGCLASALRLLPGSQRKAQDK
ncbi:MAG TPA: MFS transporter [Burkholderiales bacterium]|jgi:DHA2 family multidrug resistance protein-like MFS transporter|nr:MFS transporter [Burkholderiales bacterium]